MQLKYLNFYKIISQFATNIVGAFVPLLIYQATGSLLYTFIYVTAELSLRIIMNLAFSTLYKKYPQIMLLLRVFPVLIYSLCIFILDYNLLLGVILVGFFYAMSFSFKELPMEIIFNYSSVSEDSEGSSSKGLGMSRMFEQIGLLIAIVMGGLFLEKLGRVIPIIIAIVTYLISIVPLVIYYVKEKKNPLFNKDAVSNAIAAFKESKVKKLQEGIIKKKVLNNIAISYFIKSTVDEATTVFMIFLFAKNPNAYSLAGYMQAAMWFMFGIGCLAYDKLAERWDFTKPCQICALIVSLVVVALPFTVIYNCVPVAIVLFAIMGFFYGPISSFGISNLLAKTRILGISNEALCYRCLGYCLARYPAFIIPMFGLAAIPYALFAASAIQAVSIYSSPKIEEKNRELIVDYLQNNKMY